MNLANNESCPICNAETKFYCSKTSHGNTWIINRCCECGHGFVVNRPSIEFLTEIYSVNESDNSLCDACVELDENDSDQSDLVEGICKFSSVRGCALDVGSGSGSLSSQLRKKGYLPIMIDLAPRAEIATFNIPGCSFVHTSFERFAHSGQFEAIEMSQVLEHSLDPVKWLIQAGMMLSQQGILAVALPNFAGVYRVLGSRDPFLCPPFHLNFFTSKSLRIAFETARLRTLFVCSRSRVCVRHPIRRFSLARRYVGHVWNSISCVLNPTTLGIVLHCYAQR